ncbi:MAG: YlmC/YmxH family sporulation protein [Clostridia bacterium]|nr:YlmC/YmxH family sporulation protein [Clostridia bacterium]
MRCLFSELKCKEVINICDGGRLGCISDLEIDLCTGAILSIVVPGQKNLMNLIRPRDGIVIPFCRIQKIGEDVILVDLREFPA